MYFTDDNPKSKSIMRATMGGSDEVELFQAVSPGDLAVDKQEQKLFWTDTEMKKIEYGDLTGMNQATLIEKNLLKPVGLVVYKDYVYWIDKDTRNVVKVKKYNDSSREPVQAYVDDLSDIAVVDISTSTDHHPCYKNNCTHLCWVGKDGHAQCSCPMDLILNDDNLICGARKKCKPDQFTCANRVCITRNWVCDDTDDCKDGSDEMDNCTKCKDDEYICDSGQCVDAKKRCDSKPDCEDGSDERVENCGKRCNSNEFGCVKDGFAYKCIPRDWVCDRGKDCYENTDEMNCNESKGNESVPNYPRLHPSNLSGKMVAVIVASIVVCVIFLTFAVLMCRRLKHKPNCNVTHEIGLVVTPVLRTRPHSSASSTRSSSYHDIFVNAPLRKGPGSAGSSNKRSKVASVSNRSSASQIAYDRNNLTGASCSSTASTVVTAYFHEPLNPPPSPVTERSHCTSRSRPYCESLLSPSSCKSHRYHRPRMPPPPTPASTDVESRGSRHRCRKSHRCRYQRHAPSSFTEAAYDSDLFAPPPTPNTIYMSEATHFSDQEAPPPSPTTTERSFHLLPYPPPPSPVTDAPSVVL